MYVHLHLGEMKSTSVVSFLGYCLVFVFCTSLLLASRGQAGGNKKKKTNFALWDDVQLDQLPWEKRTPVSYLFEGATIPSPSSGKKKESLSEDAKNQYAIVFIQDIIDVIHKKQQPAKEDCKKKRLLALQMSSTSFEGTGSLLKQAMLSLAISMHSNRTMVWGLGYPFLFEHSKDVWDSDNYEEVQINNEILDCSQPDPAAGAYGCFFEPLTTCSLDDLTAAELIDFSNNAHNHSARIVLSEISKGVALYHPPVGLFDYIWSKRKYPDSLKYEFINRQAHLWAAAISAYVFRLKPNLSQSFGKKFDYIFDGMESVWGMHIRHGDLKALSNVYSYKEVFDFEDYFDAALKVSHRLQTTPSRVFVATDSIQADKLPQMFLKHLESKKKKAERKESCSQKGSCGAGSKDQSSKQANDKKKAQAEAAKKAAAKKNKKVVDEDEDYDEDDEDEDDEDYDEDEDDEDEDEDEYDEDDEDEEDEYEEDSSMFSSSYSTWYDDRMPDMLSINNSERYRTEHGSHTVAANGGCLRDEKYNERGMRCALNYEAIVHYQTLEEHRAVPRSVRLMRVLLESIEDIYLLSRCDVMIAQGSSHFSTLASLLLWARTGAKGMIDTVEFLDAKTIQQGFTPTAYLHGMNLLNGTNGIDNKNVTNGAQRWAIHTNSFISGLPTNIEVNSVRLNFDPWAPDARIKLVQGLPHVLDQLFYIEAKTWLGMARYKPTLPGHCPGKIKKGENPVSYAATVINLGVDHLGLSHYGQALQCWKDATQVINEQLDMFDPKQAEDMLSVAKDNAATLRVMRYAEMAVNENHNTKEFLQYSDKYMKKPYDGVSGTKRKSFGKGEPDEKKLMSLEDVNDEIAILEGKLTKLKQLRDRLISAHYSYMQKLNQAE